MRFAMTRWLLALGAVGLMACGGDDDDDDAGDGGMQQAGGDQPAANCVPRCEAKLNDCGQGQFAALCASAVCGDATEAQLTCVEGTACDQLVAAAGSGMSLCGIGEDGGAGGGGAEGCPMLSGCACGISGVVEINGECATSCEQACAALGG